MAHASIDRRSGRRVLAAAVIVLAVGACTSAGVPAAASPAPASAAAAVSAAPTPGPTTATAATAAPTLAPSSPAASLPPAPSASASSAGGGYNDGYGGYGGGASSAAATSSAVPASAATSAGALGTRQIAAVGTVLVAPDGLTLYTFKPDGAGVSNCNGGCASAWPPLIAATAPAAPTGSAAKITLIARSDGSKQVAWNGHPLYTYSGDSGPGEATGQGQGGVWFVVKP